MHCATWMGTLDPQQVLRSMMAHLASMGCSRARCILSAAVRFACCVQDMATCMPGGDTPGDGP